MLEQKIDLEAAYELIKLGVVPTVTCQLLSAHTIRAIIGEVSTEEVDTLMSQIFLHEQARVLSNYDHLLKKAKTDSQKELVMDEMCSEIKECMQEYVDIITL